MPAPIAIVNAALIRLGARPLESLDDDCEEARVVRARLGDVVDAVLRDHHWNCAIGRTGLARLAEVPPGTRPFAFALPADCLRVLDLADGTPPQVEGRMLLSDKPEATIRYVRRIELGLVDSQLGEAIAAKLAAAIAFRVTGNNRSAQQDAAQDYQQLLQQARLRDAQEGAPTIIDHSDWIDARL